MKRNHGIWLVIALILVIGTCSTSITKHFVSRPENITSGAAATESEAVEAFVETWASVAQPTLAIPPIGKPADAAESASGDTADGKHRYMQRLEELDAQIAKNRTASQDSSTNTMKVKAEYELRLWETEMDSMIETLSSKLNADSYDVLLTEQRTWIRERESAAMEASRKHSGSALESVEYTTSLAEQTRSRVYAIVEEYRQQLEAL